MESLGDFLHFRCHTDELDLSEFLEFLNTQADIQFVVKEYGKSNREHIHSCIQLQVAKTTFVERMKKKFPMIKGNKYYSIEKLKKGYDTNARYCYKGQANDYPCILQTVHSEEQWKNYYKSYWEEFKKMHPPEVTSNISILKKVRTRTFMEKVRDDLFEEASQLLPRAIWYHHGYRPDDNYIPPEDIEYYQEYISEFLLMRLGLAVKNIDDLIFERLYRGLYTGILAKCPSNLLIKTESKKLLNKFRNKL